MVRLALFVERARKLLIRLLGGKTVGVRAIVVNRSGECLLIRHTYREGWHLPGGGVEAGESPEAAAIRELHEEARVAVLGRPKLVGAFLSKYQGVDDYPLVYAVTEFRVDPWSPTLEVSEIGWFAPDRLPTETTPATRRRLAEYLNGLEPEARWRPSDERMALVK